MANMSLQLPSFDIPTTTDFASSSQTSNGSSSETNQHHLQLMFNLIRPEESLKMVKSNDSDRVDDEVNLAEPHFESGNTNLMMHRQ